MKMNVVGKNAFEGDFCGNNLIFRGITCSLFSGFSSLWCGRFESLSELLDCESVCGKTSAKILLVQEICKGVHCFNCRGDPTTSGGSCLANPVLNQFQVDYACTPEEVQQHFQSCGTVNRVTILTDKFGQPKGFAYVEFVEQDGVQQALSLNESELHGRQLKVLPKRTNVPGMKQFRGGRRFNPYMAGRGRRPFPPPYLYSPYGYGKVPRFRRPTRYMPYY